MIKKTKKKSKRAKEYSRKLRAANNKKEPLQYTMSDEQADNLDDIQRITQEELQYVVENLEEFEGLSQAQIHNKVTVRVRERCEKELGMELGN